MVCPNCGTENKGGFKFCVKCGSNLENPEEVNYEQVDMGGYHTEEEFSGDKKGFTFGSGTFTIRDTAPANSASDIYTADELNDSDEEFDFSMYDEPFIPKLDADRLSVPDTQKMQQPLNSGIQPVYGGMGTVAAGQPNQFMGGMQSQPMAGIPNQPVYGQQIYTQPQIVGYDQNGNPIYGQPQPMMYAQPQIVGYDQNGMPVYGQPMMYAQPQIIGYDQNGMPVYGQPMMYAQPQMMGYDQNGNPVYSQPPVGGMQGIAPSPVQQNAAPVQNVQPMQGIPQLTAVPPQTEKPKPKEEKKSGGDDFWDFFDGGKGKKTHEENDDFFGKSSVGGDKNAPMDDIDFSKLKNNGRKKKDYMGDTPIVNADNLRQNDSAKFNKMYMKGTDVVNADDLAFNEKKKNKHVMGGTADVDASQLAAAEKKKSKVSMGETDSVNADNLEVYVPEHKQALMSAADHPVEAVPKKKINAYLDELDQIELPDYMQARKTVKKAEKFEIPSLPEL